MNTINALYLNVVIVKAGLGSKVIAIAKSIGASGGTVLLGKGSLVNPILKFLELAESSKEIVLIVSTEEKSKHLLQQVYDSLKFKKRNTGICFAMKLSKLMGMESSIKEKCWHCEEGEKSMVIHKSIFVIVDKGQADQVVKAATQAGAKGATIINARGAGAHENAKIFAIDIEPEKEIVIILVESQNEALICEAISKASGIDQPGKGILFVQDVEKVMGILD